MLKRSSGPGELEAHSIPPSSCPGFSFVFSRGLWFSWASNPFSAKSSPTAGRAPDSKRQTFSRSADQADERIRGIYGLQEAQRLRGLGHRSFEI